MKPQITIIAFGILLLVRPGQASQEGMTSMPKIVPKKSFTIGTNSQGEELQDQRGYGDKESEVRMMNLMMVEGSGYEGMDMNGAASEGKKMADITTYTHSTPAALEGDVASFEYEVKITPDPPKTGANTLVLLIRDKRTKKPAGGLNPKAQVYMTSMDMGTEGPRVKEVSPGKYQVKVSFSMPGPWAVKLLLPKGEERIFEFKAGK